MRKRFLPLLTAAVMLAAGCGSAAEAEILIPIYESGTGSSYKTAKAELRDINETASIGGKVGYIYEEDLLLPAESNILEYSARKNTQLSSGDVIAVFDSSSLDYEYQSQKILTDSAYNKYVSSGSEYDRLVYEQEKAALELIQFKKDEYTIKAPYDCIVTGVQSFAVGSVVPAGAVVCTVARPDEVYVYTNDHLTSFSTGMSVRLKFGTEAYYDAKVVMTPDTSVGGHKSTLNSSAVIAFGDGELARITEEVGNIVTSGWATIIVQTVSKHNVLCIPSDAVVQYSGSTYCYIESGGSRVRVPIEVGDSYSGYTIVLSGLAEGDTVSYK